MHTDPHFAETLVRFGECAHTAAALVSEIRDPAERVRTLTSIFRAMARFFWFTIEFGLMRSRDGGLRVYGSGLLSSFGEIEHAVVSPDVQRYPLQIEWAINQAFEIDHYQPLLFIVDSFDHLYSLVDELERWMKAGKLNHVAPGEPRSTKSTCRAFWKRVAGYNPGMSWKLLALVLLVGLTALAQERAQARIPIILDTDIGDSIDDALALAFALHSPELDVRAVTTVIDDVESKTRLAWKMLGIYNRRDIALAMGASEPLLDPTDVRPHPKSSRS